MLLHVQVCTFRTPLCLLSKSKGIRQYPKNVLVPHVRLWYSNSRGVCRKQAPHCCTFYGGEMYDRKKADELYRKLHRKKVNKRIKKWKTDHPEETKAQAKKYRRTHRKEIRENNAEYRKRTEEERKEYNAEYYKKHPEEYKRRLNKWRKENPDKAAAQVHKRRALRTKAGGSYTKEEWEALKKKHKNKCLRCKKSKKLTPDHVVPISKDGSSNIENIQPLCQPCNSQKGSKSTDYRKISKGL